MRTRVQLETERQKKADELIAANALVQAAQARLAELKTGIQKVIDRRAGQEAADAEKMAELEKARGELDKAVDRTHLKMAASVEELAERAAVLTERHRTLKSATSEAMAILDDLQAQIKVQQREVTRIDTKKAKNAVALAELEKETLSVTRDLRAARTDLALVRAEIERQQTRLSALPKKEKELELMERRIRKYYEKAGLRFVD
jgi:chromosome segregation ATPase